MNRPLSMTGFGRGDFRGNGRSWTVEIRSVNHRYLDFNVKLPRAYTLFEERIKKEVATYHSRGRIDLFVSLGEDFFDQERFEADIPLARDYLAALRRIKEELKLPGDPDLALVSGSREIIKPKNQEYDLDSLEAAWPEVQDALAAALGHCFQMRQTEGASLLHDLQERIEFFHKAIKNIEESLPEIRAKRESDLRERLDNLLGGVDIDPMRLAQEVAVMADKADVTEELVRLRSHIDQFEMFLGLDEPVGRRLDFLLQEFLREINTMSSKISNASTAHLLVSMKNEQEKMREQVQNIE